MNALAVLVAILAPGLALGQAPLPPCAETPQPYKFLRFDEDYASLRRVECPRDAWEAFKYRALGEGVYGTLGGDVRIRLENGRNVRYTTSAVDPTNDIVQRYHLHTDLRFDGGVRFFGELKSNLVSGRKPGPIGTDVDRLDVHQAFIEPDPRLRVGRQEFAYGAHRRLFPRNGPNVRGSFDALRVMGRWGDWKVDALAFQPAAIDPGKFDDTSLHDQRFWGVYATGPGPGGYSMDVYYLGADRDPARFAQGLARELRHTVGTRFFRRAGAWDFDLEPALQWGRFGSGAIRAWAVAGETGYSFRDTPSQPRLSLRFGVASGDRDPAHGDLQSFNSLFPRGGSTGETWNFSPANLMHLRLGLDLRILPGMTALIGVDGFWRKSRRDGVYGSGGNVMVGATSSSARAVGSDLDVVVNWRLSRQVLMSVSAGYFRNGAFSRHSGIVKDQWLVFPSVILQF